MFKIGYYTWYHLTVENNVSREEEIKAAKALAEITGFISPEKVEESYSPFDFIFYDEMKWYDWEHDMQTLAFLFPDIVFCLWGEGEERDDNWRCYFHGEDSELQQGTISYAPRPDWSY